jgi:hypothetical protein
MGLRDLLSMIWKALTGSGDSQYQKKTFRIVDPPTQAPRGHVVNPVAPPLNGRRKRRGGRSIQVVGRSSPQRCPMCLTATSSGGTNVIVSRGGSWHCNVCEHDWT